jgi:Transposase DDE domain
MVGSIQYLAEAIREDILDVLPNQRKTQRDKLSLLIATMLHVRSANTMDLAASLPIATERIDMRYQWISRFLGNELVDINEIIDPFACFVLRQLSLIQSFLILTIDQTKASSELEVLMVSVRFGQRALPLAWCVRKTQGNIGFEDQKVLLDKVASYLPANVFVVLMGDRFFGTVDLIEYCRLRQWDYRLRLKGNVIVTKGLIGMKAKDLEHLGEYFIQNVTLTHVHEQTNIAVVHEEGHEEAWIIAMSKKPDYYKAFDYGMRWSIESMFSDFKTRGFGLEDTHLHYPNRLEKLILVMAIAMIWAVFSGLWDAIIHPLPYETKESALKKPIAA